MPADGGMVLEVGSGDGLVIKALTDAGYHPVAFDISLNALKKINHNDLVHGDGNYLSKE